MNKTTLISVTIIFFCLGFCFWSYFIYPFWPFWFTSRPMFHHWVGTSHTAWGSNIFLHDSTGAWVFFDDDLNIIVLMPSNSIHDVPLSSASATDATFQTGGGPIKISTRNRDTLVVITDKGATFDFEVSLNDGQKIKSQLIDVTIHQEKIPPPLVDQVMQLYQGQRRGELQELLNANAPGGKSH